MGFNSAFKGVKEGARANTLARTRSHKSAPKQKPSYSMVGTKASFVFS